MDPVSAAGLALSALSLSFQVFSGCVKGYELLVGIDGFEKKYDYLRHLLLVEQHRFLNWAAVANISVDKQGFGEGAWLLEQPTVLGSLKQMQSLLLDLDQLDKKFSLVLRRSDGPTEGIYSGPKKVPYKYILSNQ